MITTKNFRQQANGLKRGIKEVRALAQELLQFGLEYYNTNGDRNAGYLTIVQNIANNTHGLNARGIQAYIQAAANVQWTKNKKGQSIYKTNKGEKVATLDTKVAGQDWYTWVVKNVSTNNAQPQWKLLAKSAKAIEAKATSKVLDEMSVADLADLANTLAEVAIRAKKHQVAREGAAMAECGDIMDRPVNAMAERANLVATSLING